LFLHNAIRTVGPIWKPWNRPCAPLCTKRGPPALTELLKFEAPAAEQRQLPCPCGHHAQYQELRSKPVVTIVGPASVSRPYFLCAQCGVGQFPVDVELDIENTEFSPGVRRMHALVGQEAPFDHGRQQMKVLAGLEVTTKSVERTAEAIGANIAQREQTEIKKALQLDLPAVAGEPIPILYVQMDGTGVPVVKKETAGLVLTEKRRRSSLKNTSARGKQGPDGSLKSPLRCTRSAARARSYNRLKDLFMAAEALVQASLSDLARRAALKGSG